MFEKILLAVDGSAHSTQATAAASEIATKSGGTVHVLHVHEAGLVLPVETNTEAQSVVDQAIKQLEADGVEVSGQAVSARAGSVAPTIIDAARSFGCDLIVMGPGVCPTSRACWSGASLTRSSTTLTAPSSWCADPVRADRTAARPGVAAAMAATGIGTSVHRGGRSSLRPLDRRPARAAPLTSPNVTIRPGPSAKVSTPPACHASLRWMRWRPRRSNHSSRTSFCGTDRRFGSGPPDRATRPASRTT